MQTQEQQEQKHGFYIHSTMEVTRTGPNPEDLSKNPGPGHYWRKDS